LDKVLVRDMDMVPVQDTVQAMVMVSGMEQVHLCLDMIQHNQPVLVAGMDTNQCNLMAQVVELDMNHRN
jgi:hypothetical protein